MGQIVGAYPVYAPLTDPTPVVSALAGSPLVDGLEIPFTDERITAPPGSRGDWRYVVTLIPQTMARMASDADFGLASPDREGRLAAVRLVRALHREVTAGGRVLAVELHSAPTRTATADALFESLSEIVRWDWDGTQVVIEHCDAWTDAHPVEKGFLPFTQELDVARSVGVGLSVNWARSVIESRDPGTALAHIAAAAGQGLLRGVVFSSVSDQDTSLGRAWADLHLLPADSTSSPAGSLLTSSDLARCVAAADDAWIGFKVNMDAGTPVETRCAGLLEVARLIDDARPTRPGTCPAAC